MSSGFAMEASQTITGDSSYLRCKQFTGYEINGMRVIDNLVLARASHRFNPRTNGGIKSRDRRTDLWVILMAAEKEKLCTVRQTMICH